MASPQDESLPPASSALISWAEDAATGRPRYILDLAEHERGSNCGCICVHCRAPLTAVNAARSTFRRRPHFRHPTGAQKDSCAVLAARAAAAQMLNELGLIDLPDRTYEGSLRGLSGHEYSARAVHQSESVSVKSVRFRDQARALLTLDDGRQLVVDLTGEGLSESEDGQLVPVITIAISDPTLAAMDRAELLARLRLLVSEGQWCGPHWADEQLRQQVEEEAAREAAEHLDWPPDGVDLSAIDPDLRWQSLLHREAKAVLVREKRVRVPPLEVEAALADTRGGRPRRRIWHAPSEMVQLEAVELERPLGNIVPDVTATALQPGAPGSTRPLLIEITVSNPITEERLQRIREAGEAALEIDLSRLSGRITRQAFTRLVIQDLAGKRWLHEPRQDLERARLLAELDKEHARDEIRVEPEPASSPSRTQQSGRDDTLAFLIGQSMAILESARRMQLPGIEVEVSRKDPGAGVTHWKSWREPSQQVRFKSITFDMRLNPLEPEIRVAWENPAAGVSRPLLVVITQGPVDPGRLQRIRNSGVAALQVDLGGLRVPIARPLLSQLLVQDESRKRWLHEPRMEQEAQNLLADIDRRIAASAAARESQAGASAAPAAPAPRNFYEAAAALPQWSTRHPARQRSPYGLTPEQEQDARQVPLAELAQRYLQAVARHAQLKANLGVQRFADEFDQRAVAQALQNARYAAELLAVHGFPEARDEDLFGDAGSLLERLLTIRHDEPVGVRHGGALAAAQALKDAPPSPKRPRWHTLYLIALATYQKELFRSAFWLAGWRNDIVESLKGSSDPDRYRREPTYDRLLAELFPEMAPSLESRFGRWLSPIPR